MTPDGFGYVKCVTCGVLAPDGRPHPAEFCERAKVAHPFITAPLPWRSVVNTAVVIDEAALWGGT